VTKKNSKRKVWQSGECKRRQSRKARRARNIKVMPGIFLHWRLDFRLVAQIREEIEKVKPAIILIK